MIAINSDNLVSLNALTDTVTGNFINTATVTAQLKDLSGSNVGGTFTLAYVANSNGVYQGTLTAAVTATLKYGQPYQIWITATNGGVQLYAEMEDVAGYAT